MDIKYLDDIALKGKKVLARFDFNVPLQEGTIADTTRIDETLESLHHILNAGATTLTMMSHLGRPRGRPDKTYSLGPVATYLAEKLSCEVILTQSCLDSGIKTLLNLPETRVILLENLRFHREEEENDHEFAKNLSRYGDIFVNDAFGVCHRKHASSYEINAFYKDSSVGGFLLKKEIQALSRITKNPTAPFVGILGGAKVSDKIKVIDSLLTTVDTLLIGGAMSYPFLKAKGYDVGNSLCQRDEVVLAKKILSSSYAQKILLPQDHIVSVSPEGSPQIESRTEISPSMMGLDIGPKTLERYGEVLKGAKTVLWNGPMGVFEREAFSVGTFAMAKMLSLLDAFTLVGGGDSIRAIKKSGLSDKMDHISTGGGASLEFIEKGTLPGIEALKHGVP